VGYTRYRRCAEGVRLRFLYSDDRDRSKAVYAMKRYQYVLRTPRASVVVDVDARDGAAAFTIALKRYRAHFLDAQIWDETGLVRTMGFVSQVTAMND
jgi:hypothetical protein